MEKPDEFFAVFEKKYLENIEKEKDNQALIKLKKERHSKIRKDRATIVLDMLDMDDSSKSADNSYKELQTLFNDMERGWGDEEGDTPRRTRKKAKGRGKGKSSSTPGKAKGKGSGKPKNEKSPEGARGHRTRLAALKWPPLAHRGCPRSVSWR